MKATSSASICVISLLWTGWLAGSDWPRFRGPDGAGVSLDSPLPSEIGPGRNVLWSSKTPGGHSSPIVVRSRVFLTGHDGEDRIVVSFDAGSGKELWRRAYRRTREETFNPTHGPATPTPASDGRSLFVFFPEIGLVALTLDGDELWQKPLGPFASVQGLASSPVYVSGRIVLLIDTPTQAYLEAFDARNGDPLWRIERPTGVLGSYATPTVHAFPGGEAQIIVAGAVELTGYDAATGKRLWWAPGVTSFPAAPPFVDGDSVYTVEPADGIAWPPFSEPLSLYDLDKDGRLSLSEASSEPIWQRSLEGIDRNHGNGDGIVTAEEYERAGGGKGSGGLVRTRLGGNGDVSADRVVWRNDKGMPFLTGALLYRGVLYLVRNAIVSTFDPDTGLLLRQERLKDALGEYYASPIAGDGKIYLASLEGKVSVLRAGRDWQVLATGDLGETIVATPAISDGRIFVRTEKTLYAFSPT
jgi:outer membrane protein assembly factor BamB